MRRKTLQEQVPAGWRRARWFARKSEAPRRPYTEALPTTRTYSLLLPPSYFNERR